MRLRALFDSGVQVPDLADTEGPVAERNCIGAIPPGGEQREANDQAVTGVPTLVNSIRPVAWASLRRKGEAWNKIGPTALREWIAAGGKPQVVGDSMVGSPRAVNQGTTADDEERVCRGQSVRSSEEAG